MEIIHSPLVTFAYLALAKLYDSLFDDLLEGPFPIDIRSYTSPCYYSQYRQLFETHLPFLIPLILVPTFLATVDNARSGIVGNAKATCTGNKTDARSDLGRDVGNNRLAVVGIENRTDTGSGFGKDVKDNKSTIVDDGSATRNNRLAVGENKLAVNNNGLAARDKKIDVNDRSNAWASNQVDARPGNWPDMNLIMNNAE